MFDALSRAIGNPLFVLSFVFAMLFFGVAIYLAIILHQREKKADQRLKQARADITDMTILFQTMRDIIGQQKKLAREFNEELEHKMEQVKHILNQGMEKNKQLHDKQQRVAAELEEAQAQIDGIFRQLNQSSAPTPRPPTQRKSAPLSEPAQPQDVLPPRASLRKEESAAPSAPRPVNGPSASNGRDARKAIPPKPAAPEPKRTESNPAEDKRLADTGVTRASFTAWVAEDLSETAKKPKKSADASFVDLPPDPEAEAGPSNGDAAREAFRALLNMPADATSMQSPVEIPEMPAGRSGRETDDAGSPTPQNTAAMQQRVLEYSEAGMTVAEVSRELGIGKGEVRLMLSLAKQQAPPEA